MAPRAILSNSFEEHELKTTHNTFRDSRAHFFPTTFLKIAVYTKENGAFRTKEAFLGYLAYFAQLIKTGKEKLLGGGQVSARLFNATTECYKDIPW